MRLAYLPWISLMSAVCAVGCSKESTDGSPSAAGSASYKIVPMPKPKVGLMTRSKVADRERLEAKSRRNAELLKKNSTDKLREAVYTREVLKVEGDRVVEERLVFEAAKLEENGQSIACRFLDRPILRSYDGDGVANYREERGNSLTRLDWEALRKVLGDKGRKKKSGPGVEEVLLPQGEVKIGDSWSPDPAKLRESFLGDDVADCTKCESHLILKSVETRSGIQYGRISGTITFLMSKMGPMTLREPLELRVSLDLDLCIDGTSGDGSGTIRVDMEGTSAYSVPGKEGNFTVEVSSHGETVRSEIQTSPKPTP